MERLTTTKNPPPLMVISRKKLQSILRFAAVMIQKGVSKSKLALDLQFIIKRGKDLMTHRQITTLSCRPHDPDTSFLSPISCGTGHVDVRLSYVSPRDYQFSCCSNSPSSAAARRRRRRPQKPRSQNYNYNTLRPQSQYYNYYRPIVPQVRHNHGAATLGDGGDVEDCNGEVADSCATSTVGGCSSGGGGGSWSPLARQVRITDSPFSSMRGAGDVDCHVDTEAERFIQKFYTDLRLQKWMAAAAGREQQTYFAGGHAHNVIY